MQPRIYQQQTVDSIEPLSAFQLIQKQNEEADNIIKKYSQLKTLKERLNFIKVQNILNK